MDWSKYQLDIFDAGLNTNSNISVNATAGASKTTVLVELAKRLSKKYPYKSILFNAFNKSIVDELKKRLDGFEVDCFTLHSIGMRSLIGNYKTRFIVDEFKSFKLSGEIINELNLKPNEKQVYQFILRDMIDLMRMTMSPLDIDSLNQLMLNYDIQSVDGNEPNLAVRLLEKYNEYNKSLSKSNNLLDFTDMIYIPTTDNSIRLKKYDILLCDETQDFNTLQHKFLEKLLKQGGRIIALGDKMQSIYGFAGSDIHSFEYFENKPNTLKLPLSICYRCAKSIVKNAQKVNTQIETFDKQEEGEVRFGDIEEINSNDMVISRNVRPLVSLYFKLLEDDKKAFIKGRDIETGLIALFMKVKDFDKYEAITILNDKLDKLEEDLKLKGVKKPKEHLKYLNFEEKVKIIDIISKKVKYMFEVEKKIHDLFTDKKDAIQLMTVHKCKGAENERVFYIERYNGDKMIPSKFATQEWELTQENNLLFVALTRAKKSLIYLNYKDN